MKLERENGKKRCTVTSRTLLMKTVAIYGMKIAKTMVPVIAIFMLAGLAPLRNAFLIYQIFYVRLSVGKWFTTCDWLVQVLMKMSCELLWLNLGRRWSLLAN